MAILQGQDDLKEHLSDQVNILRSLGVKVATGEPYMAKPMATALRVLLHQTRNSEALLTQLGVLNTMKFWDSGGEINPANLVTQSTLTIMEMTFGGDAESRGRFLARVDVPGDMGRRPPMPISAQTAELRQYGRRLRRAGKWLPFDEWWNSDIVRDDAQVCFTRRDIVLAVANKDGGGHVDPTLEEPYARLSRSNSLGYAMTSPDGDPVSPFDNPVLPIVRQVGFEAERSLVTEFPELGTPPTA